MDFLKDDRVNCTSVLTTMRIREYLERIESAYRARGGIEGQRDALKSSTAIRIRERLIKDLKMGAVIPPIVIGVIVTPDELAQIDRRSWGQVLHYDICRTIRSYSGYRTGYSDRFRNAGL